MSNYRVRQAMIVSATWPDSERLLLIALGTYLKDGELSTERATNDSLRDDCGIPWTSLRRARRGLVERGAIVYTPGNGRKHPSVYTLPCLKKEAATGPLSKGDGKGATHAAPFQGERGPATDCNGGRAESTTSENLSQLVPQPELIPGPPGPGISSAAALARDATPDGAAPERSRLGEPELLGAGLATVTEIGHRGGEIMRPRSPAEAWRQAQNDLIDRWADGEITKEEKRAAIAALGPMPTDTGIGQDDPFILEGRVSA